MTTENGRLRRAPGAFCGALLLLFVMGAAQAQSEDRDNPTPLSSNTIKGTGAGKKVEYFYSFGAGPGDVALTIDLKAKSGATSAEIELFDADSNKIFYHYPNATTQNKRAVKHVTVNGKQTLTMRVALDSNAGDYAIKLVGAVEFAQAAPAPEAAAPAADNSSAPATPASGGEASPQPDASAAGAPGQPTGQKSGKGSKLDLGVNLLQAVGTHFRPADFGHATRRDEGRDDAGH